jgi:hypothetical protein
MKKSGVLAIFGLGIVDTPEEVQGPINVMVNYEWSKMTSVLSGTRGEITSHLFDCKFNEF